MTNNYTCPQCDAFFKIKHDMDESYYEVNFCPFCGSDRDTEEEDEEDYE